MDAILLGKTIVCELTIANVKFKFLYFGTQLTNSLQPVHCILKHLYKDDITRRREDMNFIFEQSRTQSPQALWPAVGRSPGDVLVIGNWLFLQ